jgi:carbamoyltransferase
MIILGLSTMGASSASIFIENKLVAAVEEERLSRIKNDDSFPFLSINECLRIANIKISDIDVVNVYWRPWKIKNRVFGVLNKIFQSKESRKNILKKLKDHFSVGEKKNKGGWIELFYIKSKFKREFGHSNFKVNYFDHHLTHMIYAENINKWKDSIILSYDGGGEELSTVLSVRENGNLKRIKSFKWPNSLGHFYSFFYWLSRFQNVRR